MSRFSRFTSAPVKIVLAVITSLPAILSPIAMCSDEVTGSSGVRSGTVAGGVDTGSTPANGISGDALNVAV